MVVGWRTFLSQILGTAAALTVGALVLILGVDPYDTGRIAWLGRGFTRELSPRMAHASRARDSRFTAAIVGNSHIQLLSPPRLDAMTGLDFVSLATPATGVREQKSLLDYFLWRREAAPKAVVIGIDELTCRSTHQRLQEEPFPFWLYSPQFWTYLQGAWRLKTVQAALSHISGRRSSNLYRRDGFWDYEAGKAWYGPEARQLMGARRKRPLADAGPPFPALDILREMVRGLPAQTQVVLVIPPVYAPLLPDPGTPADLASQSCKSAIMRLAGDRPGIHVLDYRAPSDLSNQMESFWDGDHMTKAVAQRIEKDIATALAAPPWAE